MELNGAAAIITGGASGIGRATAEHFAASGAKVLVVDLDTAGAQVVADSVGGIAMGADVSDPAATDAAFAKCQDAFGKVDIAFLNAGIAIGVSDLEHLSNDDYRRIMGVNVDAVVFGLRAALRTMTDGGAIVATASLAGLIPFPPDPIYDLTKHAVVGLMRSVAPTLEARGITANCINPGMTNTNILSPEAKQMLADAGFPIMEPQQIAEAVVHAVVGGETGQCYVCQPGIAPVAYQFRDVPGPRTKAGRGQRPPTLGLKQNNQ